MVKPVKQYEKGYEENEKFDSENSKENEIYMCEYIDAYVKRPLKEVENIESTEF